jgi:citrate lyase subunit beta/citryl-CoA lyase
MFAKAMTYGADLVFLDLEDAVPPAFKVESRAKAITALNDLDWGRTARAIRINGLDTPWCHDDLIDVVTHAGPNLDTVVIPKARTARDVWWVDVLLTQLETKLGLERQIRLEVLIEEVEGLANAEAIAVASPRVDALIFGVGDFSLSQGARVDTNFDPLGDYPGDFWLYARNKVIVAARIAGIDAIDSPYPNYKNLEGYERDARRSSLLGYTGKWAIHPTQIPIANEVYSPTADEIALAERNVAAYREAEAKGRGAVGVNGVLVDAAHVKMAQETLARAALIASGS